jgi:hypothetical protein
MHWRATKVLMRLALEVRTIRRRASIAPHESQGRSLRPAQLADQLQINPDGLRSPRLVQLDLGGPHARRREADDNVDPPVIGDGVPNQHVPQFAPPKYVSLSFATVKGGVNPSKVWIGPRNP